MSSSSARAPAAVPFEDFLAAAAATKGVPGLDGWTSAEVKFLAQECPWLLARLHSVLQGLLTRASGIDLSSHPACRVLYSWRLAGVPKRGSEESRPIAVGSVLLRAWNKALLSLLPPTPQGQWGNRKKSSVIHATEDWIKAPGTSGVELDLAKAFDTVNWGAAREALLFSGTAPQVVEHLALGWRGPRYCSTAGSFSTAMWPNCSIPQGDPASPCVLSLLLRPRHALIHSRHR